MTARDEPTTKCATECTTKWAIKRVNECTNKWAVKRVNECIGNK
ncbi:hypothetical protein ACFQZE_16580 [Paenibacillus sp. GCM10027627]